jgi:hypothetical protein
LGDCKYCGKPAGFLRSKHAECERAVQEGQQRIGTKVLHAINGSENFDGLEKAISAIEQSSIVPMALFVDRKSFLLKGWETSVEQFLEDGILDATEEKRLVEFKDHFALSPSELDRNGALTKITKAAAIRDVLNGVVPQRMVVDGNLPINFQKNEQVVWAFPNSKYLVDKIRRQYVGGSQGVSIRVMKGVYYRAGAFKGHATEHTERVLIDTGWVAITNKSIYFVGPQKSVRLPYTKIVSFEPFSDGIGIMRDAATAKLQIFLTGDGWFTYNLVTNLSKI